MVVAAARQPPHTQSLAERVRIAAARAPWPGRPGPQRPSTVWPGTERNDASVRPTLNVRRDRRVVAVDVGAGPADGVLQQVGEARVEQDRLQVHHADRLGLLPARSPSQQRHRREPRAGQRRLSWRARPSDQLSTAVRSEPLIRDAIERCDLRRRQRFEVSGRARWPRPNSRSPVVPRTAVSVPSVELIAGPGRPVRHCRPPPARRTPSSIS